MNDPPWSWLIVAAYVLAATLAFRRARGSDAVRARLFWGAVALFVLLLAINKPLDLQTVMVDQLRTLARLQGWYEGRRAAQLIFLLALGVAGGAAGLQMLLWIRGLGRGAWIAGGGVAMLIVFIVAKAASHSHLEVWTGRDVSPLAYNWILELAGIALLLAGSRIAPAARSRDDDAKDR